MRGLGATQLVSSGQILDAQDPWSGYVRLWTEKTVRKLGPNDQLILDGVIATAKTSKRRDPAISYDNKWIVDSEYISNEKISVPFSVAVDKGDFFFPLFVYRMNEVGSYLNPEEIKVKDLLGTERSFSDPAFSHETVETEEVSSKLFYSFDKRRNIPLSLLYQQDCGFFVIRRTKSKLMAYTFKYYAYVWYPGGSSYYANLKLASEAEIPDNIKEPLYFGAKLPIVKNGGIKLSTIFLQGQTYRMQQLFHTADNPWVGTSKLLRK